MLSTRSGDFLIDAASGGVIKLVEIAWQCYFYSQANANFVVTFDEPENHLHPSMQKTFLPNILKAFPNIQIIAVTHSPFIISALRDSSVYVLRYDETEVVNADGEDDSSILGLMGARVIAEKLDTVNKAGSASEILREVLGITSTIPDWAEDRVHAITQEFRNQPINDQTLKALYAQLQREGLASSYPVALASVTRAE
jgi:ATPase subunit of ABC transporter with duplicated ATPase domains